MREMRDSGVEWIGEIPKDWNCCKQKYRFTLINGRAFKDNEFEEDGTYRILRVGNLFSNPVWYSSSLELEPDKYCEKGDLIYAWSMSYGPYIWNEEKVIYHYHIWKTKLVSDMDKMFSYYYLQALTESIKSQTHETTMGFVTMGIMNNSYIAYPRNIKEQKKISNYLDAKCSKIDEIIEKQQAIIEKLKEYKFSIITEAVTKGINPDVELKDSTIDMCEQIPVHWSISQNRYLFSLRDEKNYKPLEEVRLLSLYTDLGVFPHGEQEERGNKAVKAEGYKVVYENDIVVNIILAWMGAIGRSAYDGVTSPAYDIYKPNENVCSRYYHYLYRTKPFSAECYKYGRGIMAMRWRTYSSEFKSIKVPVPPYIEQCQIADYLDSKCEMLDKTIADRNKAIEKLQEYKKSLIYEVVTGKKEV
jgi:type I restriction enzyme S subunit